MMFPRTAASNRLASTAPVQVRIASDMNELPLAAVCSASQMSRCTDDNEYHAPVACSLLLKIRARVFARPVALIAARLSTHAAPTVVVGCDAIWNTNAK